MKTLGIFLSKAQEILEEDDVDSFAELPLSKFHQHVALCPFLSHFSEETLDSLHQSLKSSLNEPIDPKWDNFIETCDLQTCVQKLKENGDDAIKDEVKKIGLQLQSDAEQNAHVLAVFSVMNKAQCNV